MKLIVGLGNPGTEYDQTRHNAGFMQVDALASVLHVSWEHDRKRKAYTAKGTLSGENVLFIKPQTFMNLSGGSVTLYMNYYKLTPADVIVIHDDVDLPMGTIKLKKNGGDGGHHGVQSVHQHLGSADFIRLRIGVGRQEWFSGGETHKSYSDAAGFVLGRFSSAEADTLAGIFKTVHKGLELLLSDGLSSAMNFVNRAVPAKSAIV